MISAPKTAPFNATRVYQATLLLPLLLQLNVPLDEDHTVMIIPGPTRRDGKRSKPCLHMRRSTDSRLPSPLNQHVVLTCLARYMAFESGPGPNPLRIVNTCYPSLLKLQRETTLSQSAVCDALSDLIHHGLITKTRIPGYRMRRGPGQNKWEHCRYHLVEVIWDSVGTLFPPRGVTKPSDESTGGADMDLPDFDRSGSSVVTATVPDDIPVEAPFDDEIDGMVKLIKATWPGHATVQLPRCDHILTTAVRRCIEIAESVEDAKIVLEVLCRDDSHEFVKRRADLEASAKLGGYLETIFPDCLDSLRESSFEDGDGEQDGDGDGSRMAMTIVMTMATV